ncbi:telomere binding protein [Coemansia brasiliensis]|uniref:Telomere binding protein n=1 Tax=Coemansia brasiliensis TaxID=2650707 RepID=A0A9W8M2Q9_9FUNG|nr:telomere binding protein [Coemansia brasiliensis]
MDIKQQFHKLEERIGELVHQLCGFAGDKGEQLYREDESLDAVEAADGDLALQTSSLLLDSSRSRASSPQIIIPGLSLAASNLITPLEPQRDIAEGLETTMTSKALQMELEAALEAPLVALGRIKPRALRKLGESGGCLWAQQWMDVDCYNDMTRRTLARKYVGMWFAKSVIISISPLIVDPDKRVLGKDAFDKLVVPYISNTGGSGSDRIQKEANWQVLKASIGVLSMKGHVSASALTLIMWMLTYAIEHTQLLDVQYQLTGVGYEVNGDYLQSAEWADYVQMICTLPERIANKIESRSIPDMLLPRMYFARLSSSASNCLVQNQQQQPKILELWTKLCRVGQLSSLCTELAASLALAARERITNNQEASMDMLTTITHAIALVPEPFGTRIVSGIVHQLDAVSMREENRSCDTFGLDFALIISTLLSSQITGTEAINKAIASVLTRFGSANLGVLRSSSMLTYQAVALALQILSGANVGSCILSKVISPLKIPNLMTDALEQVIIPLWSLPDVIQGAQLDVIQSTTALVLMCVNSIASTDAARLSMSTAFTRAIPRFLDAPVPMVRLSGVVVADCIVSRASAAIKDRTSQQDEGQIDFGLDDIIREAQTTDQPAMRASADYIKQLRSYMRPVMEQWESHKGVQKDEQTLLEAIDKARDIESLPADASVVWAPRQSTLTGKSDELQSSYIQPRKPIFLRDCLAYLRTRSNSNDSERIEIAIFALAECIERANVKAIEELWIQVANKVLYTHNRGPDSLDSKWDSARQNALVALTVKLPKQLGPFLADRACDRNLTVRDRELVLSAISTACLQISGMADEPKEAAASIEVLPDQQPNDKMAGTVVRRSRRLDIAHKNHLSNNEQKRRGQFAGLAGPAFFSPLISQFGRSDMTTAASDVRNDAGQLARYLDTLGIILYVAPAATHQISMSREFWSLVRLVRRLPARVSEALPVLNALLFGIEVVLSSDRALSTPTLAREFRIDLADTLSWINGLVERGLLSEASTSASAHAVRIVERLREIQSDVESRVTSSDFERYSSIL